MKNGFHISPIRSRKLIVVHEIINEGPQKQIVLSLPLGLRVQIIIGPVIRTREWVRAPEAIKWWVILVQEWISVYLVVQLVFYRSLSCCHGSRARLGGVAGIYEFWVTTISLFDATFYLNCPCVTSKPTTLQPGLGTITVLTGHVISVRLLIGHPDRVLI